MEKQQWYDLSTDSIGWTWRFSNEMDRAVFDLSFVMREGLEISLLSFPSVMLWAIGWIQVVYPRTTKLFELGVRETFQEKKERGRRSVECISLRPEFSTHQIFLFLLPILLSIYHLFESRDVSWDLRFFLEGFRDWMAQSSWFEWLGEEVEMVRRTKQSKIAISQLAARNTQ